MDKKELAKGRILAKGQVVVLEEPKTSNAGDSNFACGFCNPIVTIK